jgi:serine/threonine protein kinase
MESERWRLVEDLFEQALAQDPEARGQFLQDACGGDDALREEIQQLLSHHGAVEAQDFLAPEAALHRAEAPPEDPYIGQDFGPYRIQRRLGHGGMGNVYLAVRHADFRQQVAIKVLRRGMDSESILQRFRNEIQVLAALSKHENIAALLDAGTTDDGLPYFVMEYVEGEPLDAYCDHHKHSLPERIALFQQVCAAVHFAHQHMIIHRDLKMSNILVRSDGVPKLIDFGIAKLTTPELGVETMAPTAPEGRFMTLEYASPEQARGDPLTTASDVYSLGIVLYELLAGRRPYSLRDAFDADRIRIICDEEPPPPSRALTRDKPDTATVGTRRNTTAAKLRKRLVGDLDNIVLKALRKEPQRRYGTAEGLSDDLARFLDGAPVEARSIGAMELAYRWCRRNPTPAALLVTVALTLGGGMWHLSRLADQLIHATAVEGAALEAQTLSIVQDFYAKAVVAKLRGRVPVTHRYAVVEGAIPVPASFMIDLGEHIRKSQITDMSARLFSDFPFAHREGGGPQDDFERAALRQIRWTPDQPFYRFETYLGRPSLRFATARIMKKACVDCHNTHPDSTRMDWKVGDVRGVLEIIRPLDADIARTRDRLGETFLFMLGVSVILAMLAAFRLRARRRA